MKKIFIPVAAGISLVPPFPPEIDISSDEMQALAKDIVLRSMTVTGVQPKLSLTIEKNANDPKKSRFTIVGLWGNYILKPPTPEFAHLPENEDLTMHLSQVFRLRTADHSLIRLQSGELAYLTKRFDRTENEKLAQEDMCQLTETLTADKYRSSMEKIGKHIKKYSGAPGLDMIEFFDLTIFCFLTGNADMHLKNYSLLTSDNKQTRLSPAYDLVCTKIAMPDDKEEIALTLNAKKNRLKKSDFDQLAANLGIAPKVRDMRYHNFAEHFAEAKLMIDQSFLSVAMQEQYRDLLQERWSRFDNSSDSYKIW